MKAKKGQVIDESVIIYLFIPIMQEILCLDKAYNSKPQEQELIKRGYVLHIPYKRKRGEKEEEVKVTTQHCLNQKKHSTKRWVVE